MRKSVIALAAAVVAASTIATPRPAHAIAEWVIPAIIVAGVGGVAVGAGATHNAYAPRGEVYVNPTQCRVVRERTPDGWRRVRICD
jgi:hypothetical protein